MCELYVKADPILYESRSRSLRICGVVTTLRLENQFWDILSEIAEVDGMTTNQLIAKLYEEVKRGTLADLADWAADGVRGEIVLVIGGATAATLTLEDGLVQVQVLVADGMRLKEATTQVAEETGLSKRDLYQAALAAK